MTDTASPATKPRLTGSLGAMSVTFMVIAAAAPLTVVGGIMPVGFIAGNGIGFPVMFLVATAILLLFSVGLVAMSRHLAHAGAFFTYISHGLGRVPGSGAAYLALICYTTVQCAVFSFLGYSISNNVVQLGGPEIPWWVFTLASIALVGFLGYRHIELSSKVLVVVLLTEIGIVLMLAAAVAIQGGAEGITFETFVLENVLSGAPALGLMFAIASFIGFESTVVYRSEVRNPNRTIAIATYSSAIIIGLFYLVAGWAMVNGIGPQKLLEMNAAGELSDLAVITGDYLGTVGAIVIAVLFLGSMFAAVLSLHNVIARYQYSLGGIGVLPSKLAAVHPKHSSPHVSSLVQASTAAIFMLVVLLSGMGPINAFTWFAGVATLAIVILMASTCLAVIVFFARTKAETNPWRTLIAPGLGLIGLAVSAVLIAMNFPLLVGDVDAAGEPTWGLLSSVLLAVVVAGPVIGVIQALVLRSKNSPVYENITAISADEPELEEADAK
ncbi:APC family permease [Salinibacterium sp. ZJ70]|uniref:APC family permease n=1 Tax=Salinibacterium sp. ZJ70 TaxID=2708084 RepID=UPI001422067A|nr:APC family permease [Salinibacterium sp. ZJ70]